MIQHRHPLKAEIGGETIHHFLGFQIIGSPHVHDVIPTAVAQKGGAGEGGDEGHAEGGGQRGDGAGGRSADAPDEGEYAVVNQGAAVDYGGFGFIEVVQGNQRQLSPVDAAGAVGFGKGGFDAQAHIDAKFPGGAAKYRGLAEHHFVGRDAGVIGHRGGADGRRRGGWGGGGVCRGRWRIGTASGGRGEHRRRQQGRGGAGGPPEKGYAVIGADYPALMHRCVSSGRDKWPGGGLGYSSSSPLRRATIVKRLRPSVCWYDKSSIIVFTK